MRYLVLLFMFCSIGVIGKTQANKQEKLGKYEFIAQVEKVDTVVLLKDELPQKNAIPPSNFKAVVIKLHVTDRIAGGFFKSPAMLIMELQPSDHNCIYSFTIGEKYRLHTYTTYYPSKEIKDQFRVVSHRLN